VQVALCTPYGLDRISGISVFVRALQQALLDLGHEVTIFAPTRDRKYRPLRTLRLSVRTAVGLLRRRGNLDAIHANQPHVQSVAALLVARILGTRLVVTYHSPMPPAQDRFSALVQIASHRVLQRFADSLVFVSEATKQSYAPVRGTVIYLGVDSTLVRTPRTSARAVPFRLVYAGRQTRSKGFFDLLDAIGQLGAEFPDQFRLSLLGDTAPEERAEREARLAALRGVVEDLGAREPDFVLQTLASSDAILLPSYREGLPLILMEAMALGCIPIASRTGGIPELVEHGTTGLLVTPGDPNGLAAAVSALMANPQLRAGLSEQARTVVRTRFLFSRTVEEYVCLYEGTTTVPAQRPNASRHNAR